MSNKRVYLAKSNLASGLDVEYVKSNLLRIPGIEVVEYSSGIKPSECECMVVIPDAGINPSEDEKIVIGKGVATAMESFLSGDSFMLDLVYFYCGKTETTKGDKESDKPFYYPAMDFDIVNTDNWSAYAEVEIDVYSEDCLLDAVAESIDSFPTSGWMKVKRHHEPEDAYKMPPIPDVESRRASKARTSYATEADFSIGEKSYSQSSGILLFRSRRR